MIFNCYYCGWSINNRRKCGGDESKIGTCKLYNNHRFHTLCLEEHKCYPNQKNKKYYEYGESQDWNENGVNGYWKIERKIGRIIT